MQKQNCEIPSVAVYMITYNHEFFIAEAIESIIKQETNFNFQLFVGDDASNDKTGSICSSYQKKYPQKINLTINDKNIGASKNALNIYRKCYASGAKYIAMCEGDDYWTDSSKLQKQFDFLEKNKDISLCFHRANILKNSKLNLHQIPKGLEEVKFDFEKLLIHGNFIVTSSTFFRNFTCNPKTEWFQNMPFGDMKIYKLISNQGSFYCLKDNMSIYRLHDRGAWSGLLRLDSINDYLTFYTSIFTTLNKIEKSIVKKKANKFLKELSYLKCKNNKILRLGYFLYKLLVFRVKLR